MNNYADSKFITKEGLQPKRSYNKVVNLNLLNSDGFWNKNELKKLTPENEEQNEHLKSIETSMNFYSNYFIYIILAKNFDDLMKENLLSKFDCVTYKTIKKYNLNIILLMNIFIFKL